MFQEFTDQKKRGAAQITKRDTIERNGWHRYVQVQKVRVKGIRKNLVLQRGNRTTNAKNTADNLCKNTKARDEQECVTIGSWPFNPDSRKNLKS